MPQNEKWVEYAAILNAHISKVFTDEADSQIDIQDLNDEENLQAFFHALSTVVPCHIFNKVCGDNKKHIEYNHTANLLCFKFGSIKKTE